VTPTLVGRLQTRLFALIVVGGLWTAAITPVLPAMGAFGDRYRATLTVLAVVLVAGLAWEFLYHALQQFRWEKDWPTLFGLVTALNEGLAVWLVISRDGGPVRVDVPASAFLIHFTTTWLVVFLFVNGPMRVPFLRWRFKGGRLL
jgi:hypothetical protein